MKRLFAFLFLIISSLLASQNLWSGTKDDKSPIGKIRRDLEYLCSKECDGRLTGSKGETNAANYIESRFKEIGLSPYKGKYKWEFTANVGMRIGEGAYFEIQEQKLNLQTDVVFLPYSGNNKLNGACMPRVYEEDNVWLVPLSETRIIETNDYQTRLYEHAKSCVAKKASAVVYLNDLGPDYEFTGIELKNYDPLPIAVAVLKQKTVANHIKPNLKKDWIEVRAYMGYENSNATGKNVCGYIDNRSAITIVIGAQYDHLGNGLEGADDNASGVAGLLQLADMVKLNRLSRYNYLFVAFSGSKQKLQGSEVFIKQNDAFISSFNCMIDLNMLGRFSDLKKELYISGAATSNQWSSLLRNANTIFNLKQDSLCVGFSDFANFNKVGIPCIKISTGYHNDFRKKSDDITKINFSGLLLVTQYVYSVIASLDNQSKLAYTSTNDYVRRIEKTQTDLGIIPDNSYENNGIRVGACIPNKVAEKAGLSSGDVISKIGEFIIVDIEDYIEALTKTDKGKETVIVVKRDKHEFKFYVVL